MITPALIKSLRHAHSTNLSVNAELTKMRLTEDYNGSTYTERNDAILLGDTSETTFKSSCRSGRLTIKSLAAFSFIVQVSPYWYTGEAEVKEAYTDELMWRFFCEHDFLYLVRPYMPASIKDSAADEKMQSHAIEELTPERALQLLEGLYIRAPHSRRAADDLIQVLKVLAWVD